jgi:hypothetical protein
LTIKTSLIFGKQFTVLKTINHFLDLNFSFLQAYLWESATIEGPRILVSDRRILTPATAAGILPMPDSSIVRRNLAMSGHRR